MPESKLVNNVTEIRESIEILLRQLEKGELALLAVYTVPVTTDKFGSTVISLDYQLPLEVIARKLCVMAKNAKEASENFMLACVERRSEDECPCADCRAERAARTATAN
jgi:hypothetical protein